MENIKCSTNDVIRIKGLDVESILFYDSNDNLIGLIKNL